METILKRRSIRKYTGEEIADDKLRAVLQAALLAPSGKKKKPCQFYLVKDKVVLAELAAAKSAGGMMIADAKAAVVVTCDSELTDTWIEDSSIALSYMSLEATAQGIGNCWVQIHLRKDGDGTDAEANVRKILGIENDAMRIVGILPLGMPGEDVPAHTAAEADWSKVHEV